MRQRDERKQGVWRVYRMLLDDGTSADGYAQDLGSDLSTHSPDAVREPSALLAQRLDRPSLNRASSRAVFKASPRGQRGEGRGGGGELAPGGGKGMPAIGPDGESIVRYGRDWRMKLPGRRKLQLGDTDSAKGKEGARERGRRLVPWNQGKECSGEWDWIRRHVCFLCVVVARTDRSVQLCFAGFVSWKHWLLASGICNLEFLPPAPQRIRAPLDPRRRPLQILSGLSAGLGRGRARRLV